MLLHRSVLDFIKLVKLSLENIEVAALLGIKINIELLVFLKGVDNFVELWLVQEESVILQYNVTGDLIDWHAEGLLIEVLLHSILTIRFEPNEIKGLDL